MKVYETKFYKEFMELKKYDKKKLLQIAGDAIRFSMNNDIDDMAFNNFKKKLNSDNPVSINIILDELISIISRLSFNDVDVFIALHTLADVYKKKLMEDLK